MSLDQAHPELSAEQAYIDLAYGCMDKMYADVASFGSHGRNDFEREAFDRWKAARLASLSDRYSPLVFGRIDRLDDETYYIGRQHIAGEGRSTIVVDWRAPVARAFYRASAADPMELRRRRQYLLDARQLLGISDDDLRDAAARVRGDDILQIELRRQRTGRMRDIVATIQAEQDLIIRSPLEGIVVVQGGPGTGKTAIGLHRASFLLYEHREHLARHKVLVVGPNPTFMRYIAQVLPSLGETAVTQRTIEELAPLARTEAVDAREVERLKGDARMAAVLARALALRARPLEGDVVVRVQGARLTLHRDDVLAEVSRLRERGVPQKPGREMLRDALLLAMYRAYQRGIRAGSTAASFEDVAKQVRADAAFRSALDAVWPAVGVEQLVRDVVGSPTRLAAAADGILTAEEVRLLKRARAAWTPADRALMDEANALIEGSPVAYGHVVVDEAQDLSPMRLRMLARRSRDGSMTVLGDLAQATGAWARDDWGEVLRHLPGVARVEELTLGYRVSPAVMEVANAILAEAAPGVRAPIAVRAEPGEVTIVPAAAHELHTGVARLARALAPQGTLAVIATDEAVGVLEEALRAQDVAFGDAVREGLENALTVVPASMAKGLEFDAVLIVEPAAIVEQGGLRLLYIAVTRAMQRLVIAHARPLPPALVRADDRQTA